MTRHSLGTWSLRDGASCCLGLLSCLVSREDDRQQECLQNRRDHIYAAHICLSFTNCDRYEAASLV